jgi:predicted Zn finger-like uncharacterized protein
MNVTCDQCSTRYAVSDDRVRGRRFRLTCRRCGHGILIDARAHGTPSATPGGARRSLPAPTPPPRSTGPASGLADAGIDDLEDEATTMFSAPTNGLADASADDLEDEATAMYVPGRHPSALGDALGEDDEATAMFVPGRHPSALGDALGEDDEATAFFAVRESRPAQPASRRASAAKVPGGPRPLSRAESAGAMAPPTSRPEVAHWEETSVVVVPDAPDEGSRQPKSPRASGVSRVAETADEHTGRTEVGRRKQARGGFPLLTLVLVCVLILAAGTAGYLLSARAGPPVAEGHPVEESAVEEAAFFAEVEGTTPTSDTPEEVDAPTPAETPAPAAAPASRRAPRPLAATSTKATAATLPADPGSADEEPEALPQERPPFDAIRAQATMRAAAASAEHACSRPGEANGPSMVTLTLAPTGKAVGVAVKGPLSSTTTGLCIKRHFGKVSVPPFSGPAVAMEHPVRIP